MTDAGVVIGGLVVHVDELVLDLHLGRELLAPHGPLDALQPGRVVTQDLEDRPADGRGAAWGRRAAPATGTERRWPAPGWPGGR